MYKHLIFIVLACILMSTCGKKEVQTSASPRTELSAFFEKSIGHTTYYTADSIIYNDFNNSIDTLKYLLKDSNISLSNNVLTVYRYQKKKNKTDYLFKTAYQITYFENKIEEFMDNLRIIPLTNPLVVNASWKGSFDTSDFLSYTRVEGNANEFTKITVEHTNTVNLIQEITESRTYNSEKGLIEIISNNFSKDIDTGKEIAGYKYTQTRI